MRILTTQAIASGCSTLHVCAVSGAMEVRKRDEMRALPHCKELDRYNGAPQVRSATRYLGVILSTDCLVSLVVLLHDRGGHSSNLHFLEWCVRRVQSSFSVESSFGVFQPRTESTTLRESDSEPPDVWSPGLPLRNGAPCYLASTPARSRPYLP